MITNDTPLCPIRGAIKTVITTSTDNLVAGEDFSIFITIQNPFERALLINSVTTSFPTEFIDLNYVKRELIDKSANKNLEKDTNQSVEDQTKYPTNSNQSFASQTSHSNKDFFNKIRLTKIQVGFPGLEMEFQPERSVAKSISYNVKTDSETTTQSIKEPIPLQPGNTTVRSFTIRTKRKILFNPSTYRFNIEIDYTLDDSRNLDTIEHIVNIRASLTSIIVGAIVGGFAGWFINKNGTLILESLFTNIISLIGSVLISLITVVLLARKKEIQPLITVEDIWGGFTIGFIAAYSGPSFLENLVQPL